MFPTVFIRNQAYCPSL